MADARSGRAPRPAPRRGRCCGWSCRSSDAQSLDSVARRPRRRGPAPAAARSSVRSARSRRRHCRRTAPRSPARGRSAKRTLAGSACAVVDGGGDPERAVERAREVGGEQAGDPQRLRGPSDLGELQRRRVAGPELARQRRASATEATLSSATIGTSTLPPHAPRAPRGSRHGCSTSSSPELARGSRRSARPPSSTSQAPLASIRILRPRIRRLADGRDPRRVVARPDLDLEGA